MIPINFDVCLLPFAMTCLYRSSGGQGKNRYKIHHFLIFACVTAAAELRWRNFGF